MDSFIDIDILNNIEFPTPIIMNAIFGCLHKSMSDFGESRIGVTFPQYGKTLGNILRLHGSESDLVRFMFHQPFRNHNDYIMVKDINRIPNDTKYVEVRRVQVKSNMERLYRRSVKKGIISESETLERLKTAKDKKTKLPFVSMKSASTGQVFRLFICQKESSENNITYSIFNNYGLSDNAILPFF